MSAAIKSIQHRVSNPDSYPTTGEQPPPYLVTANVTYIVSRVVAELEGRIAALESKAGVSPPPPPAAEPAPGPGRDLSMYGPGGRFGPPKAGRRTRRRHY
jgi:hypothetical protein